MGIEITSSDNKKIVGTKRVRVFMVMETDIYSDGTFSIPRVTQCFGSDFDKKRVVVPKNIKLNTESLEALESGEI